MNKVFENVSESAFDCLKSKLQGQGITLDGNSGYLSKNGISLDFKFVAKEQTLSIENLEVGFPASLVGMNADKVLGILDTAIVECKA